MTCTSHINFQVFTTVANQMVVPFWVLALYSQFFYYVSFINANCP